MRVPWKPSEFTPLLGLHLTREEAPAQLRSRRWKMLAQATEEWNIAMKYEIKKIEGMCVTKDNFHYHTALKDEQAKVWYLNSWWGVSVGHCHEPGLLLWVIHIQIG